MATSAMTKWLATMVLVILGALVYKYVLSTPIEVISKNNAKKKQKKKRSTSTPSEPDESSAKESAKESTPETPPTTEQNTTENISDSSDDEDGLSAAQILSNKHFGAAAMCGAQRMATPEKPIFQLQEGQRVLAQYQNQREWFAGTITKIQRGNLYTVEYDDGEIETKVPIERIRMTNGDSPWSEDVESSSESNESNKAEDEWEVVKAPSKIKAQRPPPPVSAEEASTGLTKKQRESRRRKEKLREQKELMRSEAQEGGLHARWGGTKNKWIAPNKCNSSLIM
ncbi:hypothetical protein THRCLA_07996 [Thraustotheca clavata]|uniref:Agenet-like domain-containing protein n=1 Tax=Thraustotheca clavata TaxID=74557 RepID=A0A1V9ZB24_9STRA|nr:hypothetical protein THRCLA_07996 [Thraustotheca clavata]